jgi:hypothetical protein
MKSKGEATFKASQEKNNQEQLSNHYQSYIYDEEVANFMKKLNKGTGKYKGKIPLKFFNYGKVGNFSSKCPYPKQEEIDNERTFKEHKMEKPKTKRRIPFTPKRTTMHMKKVKMKSQNIYLWV